MNFTGVIPILATPFREDELFDAESMINLVKLMKNIGVDGITVLGVLGEANRLSDREREDVLRNAVAAADGLPVIAGASASGTRATCDLAQMAQSLGASAVMITPHAEPVPSDERVFKHFAAITNATDLPIVLQDHPASSGVHMPTSLMLRMISELPAISCIKEEAVPTPPKIRALKQGMTGRSIPILTGLGALYGLFDLEAGSDGFNTGFAFPEVLMAMVAAARAEEWQRVRELYTRFLPLIVFEQQPGVAVRKEILRLRRAITSGRVRQPGAQLNPETGKQLGRLINSLLPDSDLTQPIKFD
ncbi:MAG: dihydrodipicolinate synthase family protein [Betaproteobacteria bacterium]|nr:MAG: dihydrodipicolinate synthase family protein [Betaproteobacteria bacterium]